MADGEHLLRARLLALDRNLGFIGFGHYWNCTVTTVSA
jgi:hypothetical protein